MASKTVRTQQRNAAAFAASARTLAQKVQEAFAAKASPFLREGETIPDLIFVQELISRWLEQSGANLLVRDVTYVDEIRRAKDGRTQLARSTSVLRERLRDARHLIERSLGKGKVRDLFARTDFSEASSLTLTQIGREVRNALRDPKYDWASITGDGLLANAGMLADVLDREIQEVDSLLAEADPVIRSKQLELGAKQSELEAAADANRRCAALLTGLYRMAGLDFHAQRLRSRPRAKPDEPAVPAKGGGAAAPPISGKEAPATSESVH